MKNPEASFKVTLFLFLSGAPGFLSAGPFEDALDGNAGTYDTSPANSDAPWTAVAGPSNDGVDAVQSGLVSIGERSGLALNGLEGPGVVSFFWAVSAEPTNGANSLVATGFDAAQIGPIANFFTPDAVRVNNASSQTVFFEYSQNVAPMGTPGIQNRAWLDEVYFIPQPKRTAGNGAADDDMGSAAAAAGNLVLVGASGRNTARGAAYLFDVTDPLNPVERSMLVGDGAEDFERFGGSVAVCGNLALVGAFGENSGRGAAYLFDVSDPMNPVRAAKLNGDGEAFDLFGVSVALHGNLALIGEYAANSDVGQAILYDITNPTAPLEITRLMPSDGATGDLFGISVALLQDVALIGANSHGSKGAAYLFDISNPSSPQQLEKLEAAGASDPTAFGTSVALYGELALIGARGNGTDAGAAYLYDITDPANPALAEMLTDADGQAEDGFGVSVSLTKDFALVGARNDDDDGIAADGAGSALLFDVTVSTSAKQRSKLTAFDLDAGDFFGIAVAISGNRGVVGADADNNGNGSDAGGAYFPSLPWVADLTEVSPAITGLPATGGSYPLRINAVGAWNAASDSGFAAVGAASGTGNAGLEITVAPNPSAATRIAKINVNGVEHTVTQAGTLPTTSTFAPPVIDAPGKVKAKKKGKITARVGSALPVTMQAKAKPKAKVKVTGGNPFKIVVKKLKKKVTRVTLITTDSLGRSAVKVVKVKRK